MAGAIEATGIGETKIKEAIANSDLIAHYNGTKLVIRAADLDEWIRSLPTENPRRSA
ncbi:hypothetical protein [Nocardioides alcanivorans]|uniref:hypothetical protein n=1 Tax=Nocardioides alcanivorans TaxID=2897352 RepID=UPI001F218977|nr:hypothetical protein [Nocardioides alcanivorans]